MEWKGMMESAIAANRDNTALNLLHTVAALRYVPPAVIKRVCIVMGVEYDVIE